MLERTYKCMLSQGYSLDTIYTYLNRGLLFLKYIEALGKTIDEITLDEIQDYLSTRGKTSTIAKYIEAIKIIAKVNIQYKPTFFGIAKYLKHPKKKIVSR